MPILDDEVKMTSQVKSTSRKLEAAGPAGFKTPADPLDLTGLTALQRKEAARLASQPPSRQSESKTQAARLSQPPQKTELRGTFKPSMTHHNT